MRSFIIYLIEVNICLLLFYLVYLVFKGDTFFHLKRIYLLLAASLSLFVPQVSSPDLPVEIEQILSRQVSVQKLKNVTYHDTFEKVVFGQIPEKILAPENNTYSFIFILLGIIYAGGVIYFFFRFLKNLFHVYHLYKKNKKENYLGYKVILLSDKYPTFSFFNCIFLNKKNLIDSDIDDVISHELMHIKQKHTYDIMFLELNRILFWFNPIIWLYKSEIVKVHECLADRYFVENKPENIIDYQSLLIKQYLSKIHIELAHPFNYSLIKYRIKMMTKNKSKWWAKSKIGFAIPIIVTGLVAFSNADNNLTKKLGKNGKKLEANPKGMVFIPQGSFTMTRSDGQETKEYNVTVDAFWMKETEVSVKEYNEYLVSLKKDTTPEVYQAAIPDYSKAPYENYFTSKKYKDYPVVGITLTQAMKYCDWLTNKEYIEGKGKKFRDYRIPLEEEWIYASFGGVRPDEVVKPEISPLSKAGSKKPNEWGLYNMFDNVSEWTAIVNKKPWKFIPEIKDSKEGEGYIEEGKLDAFLESFYPAPGPCMVKGNNYKNSAIDENLVLENSEPYEYVGFRYVRSYMAIQE